VRAPRDILRLLRMTVSNIWAQEKAHAAYLDAILLGVARPRELRQRIGARLERVLGSMEGRVLSGSTSPSELERAKAGVLLAIGRQLQDVPAFVSSLSALSFRDFCLLNAELEVTAIDGYERMLVLLDTIRAPSSVREHTTLVVDVGRMVDDERFHNETFATIALWLEPATAGAGSLRPGLSFRACAASLAEIRARIYRTSAQAERGAPFGWS